jgi:hypothetical protein
MREEVEKRIVVMIDETNDPGSRVHGNHYIIGATVVDRDNIRAFARITKSYASGHEMKFYEDVKERELVLDKISKLNVRLYAETIEKPIFPNWNDKEQLNVHRTAVFRLMERIVKEENADRTLIIIDENNKAKPPRLKEMGRMIAEKHGKNIIVVVKRSKMSFHLQTNDFNLGGMNKKYNHDDNSYIERTGAEIKHEALTFERRKSARKND